MVQATIILEDMIKTAHLKKEWWYWSSPSAATKIKTVSSLALYIYALDAAISYEKPPPPPTPPPPPPPPPVTLTEPMVATGVLKSKEETPKKSKLKRKNDVDPSRVSKPKDKPKKKKLKVSDSVVVDGVDQTVEVVKTGEPSAVSHEPLALWFEP